MGGMQSRHNLRIDQVLELAEGHGIIAESLKHFTGEDKPETVRVFNLIKALFKLVSDQGRENPYLIPIGERAQQIALAFEERQLTAQQALEELEGLICEYRQAVKEQTRSGLSSEGFGVYWLLKREKVEKAEPIARQATKAFERFPHWKHSADQERQVRTALYKALISVGVDDLELVDHLLQVLGRAS